MKTRYQRLMMCGVVVVLSLSSVSFGEEHITIAMFTPRAEHDMFWGPFVGFMQEAVNDLNMELEVYYANDNRMEMKRQIEEAVTRADKPDALVIKNFQAQGEIFIEIADDAEVPIFVVNTGFQPEDNMGKPREKYRYWIGEMLPDDEGAGFGLAELLIQEAAARSDENISLLGIEGYASSGASIERVKGLKRALEQHPEVELTQILSANWKPDLAKEKFMTVKHRRYPDISVVWTASDGMALGVIEGAKELDFTPAQDIFTGGVDWSEQGLQAVKSGEMTATMGGHFMEGAWVAVVLYDYFNGIDFASESLQMRSKMSAITRANIDTYIEKLHREQWHKIDFTQFSKQLNPELKTYNFGLEALLDQL